MADKRRVVRRMASPARQMFDDQVWPVLMSLLVLGGFLVGTILAFQSFDEPRWYANAWFSLSLVIAILGGAALAVYYAGNRFLRRAMQLAVVVCAIVHVALILLFHAANVFERLKEAKNVAAQPTTKRQPRVIRRYLPEKQREKLERDLHTPTETPKLVKQEDKQPEREQPQATVREVQPVPIPNPQRETTPEVVRKRAQSGTPRLNDQLSKASRQRQRSQKKMNLPTAADQVAPKQANSAPKLASQKSPVQRQTNQQSVTQRANATPDESRTRQASNIQRRSSQRSEDASTTRSREVPRRPTQQNPLAQVPTVEAPTTSRRTSPTAPRPTNTLTQRAATASPVREQPIPVPEIPDRTSRQVNRRQQQTPTRDTLAKAPTRTNTPRPKATMRVANVEVPQPSKSSPKVAAQTAPRPANTSPQRESTRVNPRATDPSVTAQAEPRVNRQIERRERTDTIRSVVQKSSPERKQTSNRSPSTDTAATQVASSTKASSSSRLNAAATSQPRVAASATTRPLASQPAPATSNQQTPTVTRRRDAAATAASRDTAAVARRSSRSRTTRTVRPSTQAPVPNSTNLANTGRSQSLQPAVGAAARIQSRQSGAKSTSSTAPAPARSPTSRLASRNNSPRASAVPTMEPSRAAGEAPARSRSRGKLATNTNAENPTANSVPSANSAPAMSSARTALARATTGTAGVGQGANLDKMEGSRENSAALATASARRASSSQTAQPGPALTPRQPATGRSRLSQNTPSVAFRAQSVPNPNAAGSQRPGSLNAASGSVRSLSQANTQQGEITGAKGTVAVDAGTSQLMKENRAERASGGGRPTINAAPSDSREARRPGTTAPRGITASALAETIQSPTSRDGGSPKTTPSPRATSLAQQNAGGNQPASGDPTTSREAGDPQLAGSAGQLAASQPDRARSSDNRADTLDEDDEDEEKKARQANLRRSAGNRAAPALGTPLVVDIPQPSNRNTGAGSAGGGAPGPRSTNLARTEAAPAASGGPGAAAPAGVEGAAAARPGAGAVARATGVRVEQTDGANGAPQSGGGTASRRRMATGRPLATDLTANVPNLAGGPQSSGAADADPIAAAGGRPNRIGGGAPSLNSTADKAGGSTDSNADQPGLAVGTARRRQSRSIATAGDEPISGGPASPAKRGRAAAVATNTGAEAVAPTGAVSGPGEPDMGDLAQGSKVGPMTRQASEAIQVSIEAEEGSGGLGLSPAPDTGIPNRSARRDSLNVQRSGTRIAKRGAGALPTLNTAVTVAANPFRGRSGRPSGSNSSGLGPQTEEAIQNGLAYLSRRQLADGRWSLQGHERGDRDAQFSSDTAATGLALLAFQGAGFSHKQYKYKARLAAALKYLVSRQNDDGDLFDSKGRPGHAAIRLYSHSIAALALCEAYGMTQDPELREPAQKSLDFIIAAQHPKKGGWRYVPQQESDTSVTGWMMMALKSGDLAGLKVPKTTYDKIRSWLDSAKDPREGHLYRYNPYATDSQSQGRKPTASMTSVGMLMRLYLGWKRDNGQMVSGAKYLMQNLPRERDTYYWYYATQVMFHMRGEYWEKWNGRLYPMLIGSQVKSGAYAGSWDPWRPTPDRWAGHAGRIYVTTMNLLSLEVHYRHLPLYEETLLPRIWTWPQGLFQDAR